MRIDIRDLIRRGLGAAYVAAGIGKCFPAVESTPQRLAEAVAANEGHPEAATTRWLSAHPQEVNTLVAVAMASVGTALLGRDEELANAALAATIPMLACFVAVLRRARPVVMAVDALFAAAAVYLLINARWMSRRGSAG